MTEPREVAEPIEAICPVITIALDDLTGIRVRCVGSTTGTSAGVPIDPTPGPLYHAGTCLNPGPARSLHPPATWENSHWEAICPAALLAFAAVGMGVGVLVLWMAVRGIHLPG